MRASQGCRGGSLDLPVAVGVLIASEQLPASAVEGMAFVGELGLDGSVRRVAGVIPLVDAVGERTLVLPAADVAIARCVAIGTLRGVSSLRELVAALKDEAPWASPPLARRGPRDPVGGVEDLVENFGAVAVGDVTAPADQRDVVSPQPDLADVRGQRVGRRAVEVAAAGGHHLLMVGPPGSGKTMLAGRIAGLLPPLTREEALEVSRIHSSAGLPLPSGGLVRSAPYRAPHHGASAVSLVGGGTWSMRPGEISLATHGVLFLDEMGEFPATVLDVLRQPLEEGVVRVSRARGSVIHPARFQLVGAMNPCPCGDGTLPGACRCTEAARLRYLRRISGPLLDRFDLVVPLRRPDPDELLWGPSGESSREVARRVAIARRLARRRGVARNADLQGEVLERVAPLSTEARRLLERHVRTGRLSARGLVRLRRVARTVADLEVASGTSGGDARGSAGETPLTQHHVAEALALHAGRAVLLPGTAAAS